MHTARAGALAAALGISVSACGGAAPDPSGAPASSARDSAGVSIVDNERPGPSHRVGWSIGYEPAVSVGTLEGDERYQLFRVVDALVLGDGRIAVANRGTSQVRIYDGEGRHLADWGRAGEGPGEFTSLSRIDRWRGDSLVAWDLGARRVTVFDGSGSLGRTFGFASDERVPGARLVDVLAEGRILVRGSSGRRGDPPSGLLRPDRPYAIADADGAILSTLGTHPGAETFLAVSPDFVSVTAHPFARRTLEAFWGGRALLAPTDRYEITVFDPPGTLVRSVRRAHDAQPVTEGHMSRFVASRFDSEDGPATSASVLRQYEDMPLVETFPAFDELHVDALDHLWVRDYVPPPDEGVRWTVFDPAGRVMGWIETPPGVEVMEIGADYLLGLARDALDVERVRLWPLDRSATGAASGASRDGARDGARDGVRTARHDEPTRSP